MNYKGQLIKLTSVTPREVSLLSRIGMQTYKEHFSGIWSEDGMERYLETHFTIPELEKQLADHSVHYFFIHAQNRNVGLAKIKINQRLPAPPFDHGLELEKLYLLSAETGKGFGTDTLRLVVQWAKEKNTSFMWLDVLKSNQKARDLYRRVGFKTVGEIPFETDISKIGMWIMRLDLNK
jgi:diamine N-acetyltransferase